MNQTELLNTIRAEIERLKLNVYDEANQFDIGARSSLTYLDSFLDSLPEQPAGEGLEEEIKRYGKVVRDKVDIKRHNNMNTPKFKKGDSRIYGN